MNFFKKMGKELSKQRTIDVSIEKTLKSVKSGYRVVPSREITAWKAYLAVTFVAGFSAALIWSAYVSVYPVSRAEDAQVTLFTSAAAASHKSGDEFPIQIILNTAGKNIVAVQAIFNYDKNAVQVVNMDTTGSDFNYEIKNSVDTNQGQGFLALAKPTPGVNSASVKVATVNLKALSDISEPVLQLKFDSLGAVTDSAAILDDGNGTNVLQKLASLYPSSNQPPAGTSSGFIINSNVSLADTLVRLDWSSGPVESGNYLIERKTGKATFSKVSEASSTSRYFVNRGLKPNTVYVWRICQQVGAAKNCTGEKSIRTLKKKKIFKPRLNVLLQDGKVNLSWIPAYSIDFRLVLQKRLSNQKKFQNITVVSSDSQNTYLDENVASGQQIFYRLIVSAKKKTTQQAKDVKITIP